MTSQPQLSANVRRLIAVHALSACAMGLPWPALLVAVWNETHSEAWLGAAGAARMAPYVLLSWLAGRLADRMNRGLCVRASLVARTLLLLATALLVSAGAAELAVVGATMTIASGTVSYPAIAADMPKLAGDASDQATGLLVTVEVGAFFVGPALGGLALGWGLGEAGLYAAVLLALASVTLVRWVTWPTPDSTDHLPSAHFAPGLARLIAQSPQARAGLAAVTINNAVDGAVGIALLPLAAEAWSSGERAFGLATAALGFGALLTPVFLRTWGIDGRAGRRSAMVFAVALVFLAASSGLWWALVPIAVVGTASVHVEAVATTMMQQSVPDHARASLLGLADSVMVGSAAVAAAITPYLTQLVGPRVLVLCCAGACLLMGVAMRAQRLVTLDQGYLASAISSARR